MKIDSDSVIISYDISDDSARNKLKTFLTDILKAKEYTESTYEFVFSESICKWNAL